MRFRRIGIVAIALASTVLPVALCVASSLGTAFTYQGRLLDSNSPANGLYDFEFKLYDAVTDGNQLSTTLYEGDVDVNDGDFMVDLDFGSDPNSFNGQARWLATGVRPGASTGSYTPLGPRQELTPAPYALYSASTVGIDVNDTDGYVGIGTDNPQAKLHIDSPITGYGGSEELLRLSRESTGVGLRLLNFNGADVSFTLQYDPWNTTEWFDLMSFSTYGRIGIGTTTPASLLHLAGSGPTIQLEDTASGNDYWTIHNSHGSGTLMLYSSVAAASVMNLTTSGNVGIGTTSPNYALDLGTELGPKLAVYSNSAGTDFYGLGISSGVLEFYAQLAPNTPEMVLTGTGRLGIGTTNPTEVLDVNGVARLRGISAGTGTTVVADANGKLWKDSSSRRYKTNIEDLPVDRSAVLQLRPVSFQWHETGQPDVGLVAEEVEQLVPGLVIYDRDGRPDGVKYQKLAVYLLDVVRAQEERIRALEEHNARDESWQRRLEALEEAMAQSCVRQARGE